MKEMEVQGGLAALNALTRLKLEQEEVVEPGAAPHHGSNGLNGTGSNNGNGSSQNGNGSISNNHTVVTSDSK
jgi:hypothetical protein